MERRKQKNLERAGWRVGSSAEFLELSPAEAEVLEMKHALSVRLRKAREQVHITQVELAERMGSSQSRVAKMEAGGPGVTLDLLILGLLAVGVTRKDVANTLGTLVRKKAAGE